MSFKLLDDRIKKLIKEKGFLDPSPAQKLAIEPIIKERNILLISSTGLGKTEACLLPLFHKLLNEKNSPISVLYITPLKSLNRDLEERMMWWCKKIGLTISVRHGDTSRIERVAQKEMPPNILVTTPESLGALLVGKKMREHLKNVKCVVIDEIHEIVGSKRGIQLSLLLERLAMITENKFQRIGLSATVGSPELVANFLQGSGEKVNVIRAEGDKKYSIKVENPIPTAKDMINADQLFIGTRTYARLKRIEEIMKSQKSVLVFTNTRETAEVISSRLHTIDKELKQSVHHGSLSKEKRISSEKGFKKEELKALVATSSLELGIDIGSIDMVVQYLSSRQVTRLIQRIGRAGHKLGETSNGILLSGEEDLFESAAIAQALMKRKLEQIKIHDLALDVLTSQIIGILFDEYEITEDRLYKIISSAYPYRNLKKGHLSELLNFLEAIYLIWIQRNSLSNIIKRRKKCFDYYFTNLTMISDSQKYKVISIIQNEPVGSLDEAFVSEHGKTGEKFIFSGRAWKIIQVDEKKVIVEPIEDIESAIPAWIGELIPVSYEISQEVGKIRKYIMTELRSNEARASTELRSNDVVNTTKSLTESMEKQYHISKSSSEEMIDIIKKHISRHVLPTDDHILIEHEKNFVIIHMCTGSLVNDTLGRYLAAMIAAHEGRAINVKTDPYRIILETGESPEHVKKLLESADRIEDVLRLALENSQLFKNRFLHVARRFGIISKTAEMDRINLGKIISHYHGSPAYNETMREILLEKMDIGESEKTIEKIRTNEIRITIQPGLSYLGELGLTPRHIDVLKPGMPEEEILKAFKNRILNTYVRLACLNCGAHLEIKQAKDIDDQPECSSCGSILISCLHRNQRDISRIIKKKISKKPLNEEEKHIYKEAQRSADMIIAYGKRTCICLAGRGIGPETASRILSMLYDTDDKLFRAILEAEKTFARTKIYWK